MNKVISIHLNGSAFQVEDEGHAALQAYLEEAQRQLAGNPDADEILLDLEQAIADKCRRFLSANKNVVLNDEIRQIIEEMGPVQDVDMSADSGIAKGRAEEAKPESAGLVSPPRQSHKLYRLKNDRMVEGVCAGIGAYFGVDPTIIRTVAVILLILSGGLAGVIYLMLIVLIPEAETAEEHAAAHGAPFNAKEVLERAKANLQRLHQASEQRQQRRRQPAYWHRHADRRKGCLGLILTLVAFIFGVSLLMRWLRWPFNSAVVRDTFITPYQPWGTIAIFVLLIVGLGALLRTLRRSGGGTGTLLTTILNFCLVILVLTFLVYLAPLALAGSVNLWNQPWAPLAIFVVLIGGLGILVRRLARSKRSTDTLPLIVLNVCLVILVLAFLVFLAPVAWRAA